MGTGTSSRAVGRVFAGSQPEREQSRDTQLDSVSSPAAFRAIGRGRCSAAVTGRRSLLDTGNCIAQLERGWSSARHSLVAPSITYKKTSPRLLCRRPANADVDGSFYRLPPTRRRQVSRIAYSPVVGLHQVCLPQSVALPRPQLVRLLRGRRRPLPAGRTFGRPRNDLKPFRLLCGITSASCPD